VYYERFQICCAHAYPILPGADRVEEDIIEFWTICDTESVTVPEVEKRSQIMVDLGQFKHSSRPTREMLECTGNIFKSATGERDMERVIQKANHLVRDLKTVKTLQIKESPRFQMQMREAREVGRWTKDKIRDA
jgi:hypothetical protein